MHHEEVYLLGQLPLDGDLGDKEECWGSEYLGEGIFQHWHLWTQANSLNMPLF